jgi:hypothetical protein
MGEELGDRPGGTSVGKRVIVNGCSPLPSSYEPLYGDLTVQENGDKRQLLNPNEMHANPIAIT